MLSAVLPEQGIEVTNVDHTDLDAYKAAFKANTKLVLLESPTNPRMQVQTLTASVLCVFSHAKTMPAIVVRGSSIDIAQVFSGSSPS